MVPRFSAGATSRRGRTPSHNLPTCQQSASARLEQHKWPHALRDGDAVKVDITFSEHLDLSVPDVGRVTY